MKTIRRNALKMINKILDERDSVKHYTLSNCFSPKEIYPINKEELFEEIKDARSIYLLENGTLRISIHSNHWIEVYKA